MTDDRPAVPASMPWRGTGGARANSASPDARMPVEADAPVEGDAPAAAYRLEQARKLLDELAAALPEGDRLRRAIERGRATEGLPSSSPAAGQA